MELKISILGLGLNILATFMLGDVLFSQEQAGQTENKLKIM